MTKTLIAAGLMLGLASAASAIPAGGEILDHAIHASVAGQPPVTIRTYASGKADMVRGNVYQVGSWGMKDADTICFAWPTTGEYGCWAYRPMLKDHVFQSVQQEGGDATANVTLME